MIGKTISHYKIVEKLGQGGMGVVYRAHDTKLKRDVAIKFLPGRIAANQEERERFKIEAQAAAALNHPNIATIYAIEEVEDELFIAMEYIEGQELKGIIGTHRNMPLPFEEVISYTKQIAEGLQAAHKKGIVHRDIKSSNIMITREGKVKIMDFGLAKVRGGALMTKVGTTLGTAAYMSPEQTRGEEVDQRADIWSLGVIFYEMITNQLPFGGDYEQAVVYSILNETPEPLSAKREDLPEMFSAICNKLLSKKPADRYQYVDEFLADLIPEMSKGSIQPIISVKETRDKTSATKGKLIVGISALIILVVFVIYIFIFKGNETGELTYREKIVVLPFENLGSADEEYFAAGITEEINSKLSEIKGLAVIGRTSANQYKGTNKSVEQIGNELGVNYILEGTVRWEKQPGEESRVRVTPRLIKVADGVQIWTKPYDAILESVFAVQSDIASRVATTLNVTLAGTEQKSISQKPTENVEAYDYYLRGMDYVFRAKSAANHYIAEQMFLRAIELDPKFALAYVELAITNLGLYWFHWDRSDERLANAKGYIEKAAAINPDLPDVYRAWADYYYHGFLEYDKALAALEKGLKLKPEDWDMLSYVGFVKRRQGEFMEAIRYFKETLVLDPLAPQMNEYLGETYLLLRNYGEAEKYFDREIEITPDWGFPHEFKARIYVLRDGDLEKAYQSLNSSLNIVSQEEDVVVALLVEVQIMRQKYDEALQIVLNYPAEIYEDQFRFILKDHFLARIYALQNNQVLKKAHYESARKILEAKLEELPDDARSHSALGLVYAGLGNKEEAIKAGLTAVEILSIEKEAWRGFFRELDLARIYAMVGEGELAVDKLEYLLSVPGELSVKYLKLDPVWRPLHKNERFKRLLDTPL